MQSWLAIAANRNHAYASALSKKLSNSLRPTETDSESDSFDVVESEATTLLLELRYEKSLRVLDTVDMSHISHFDVYRGDDTEKAKQTIQEAMLAGRSIEQITGLSAVNSQNNFKEKKLPLLHWAAWRGRSELIKVLLDVGVKIDALESRFHATAPQIASGEGSIGAAEMLLREGASAGHPDCFGWTASDLVYTVPPYKLATTLELLHKAPSLSYGVLLPPKVVKSETPLSATAELGHLEAVETILKRKADRMTRVQLFEALKWAVKNNLATLCETILNHELKIFGSTRAFQKPFPSIATQSPYILILFHGQQISQAFDSTVRALLPFQFDINGVDEDGETAMHKAVSDNGYDSSILYSLLEHGASLITRSNNGNLPLQNAIVAVRNSSNEGHVPWLLHQGVPLVVTEFKNGLEFPYKALHYACIYKAYGAVKALLEHPEVDVNLPTPDQETALHFACTDNSLEIVRLLLEHGANACVIESLGTTPLERAIDECAIDVVVFFLESGLSIYNDLIAPTRSALDYCASKTQVEQTRISQILFRHPRFHSESAPSLKADTAYHLLAHAVKAKQDNFALEMILAGIDIEAPQNPESAWKALVEDEVRIHYYSAGDARQRQQYQKLMKPFVDRFVERGDLDARDSSGNTLLIKASQAINASAVRTLLDAGASVNSVNDMGLDALCGIFYILATDLRDSVVRSDRPAELLGQWEPATDKALLDIVNMLLDTGADPNTGDKTGMRPIHLAVMSAWRLNSAACVELLCQRGADANAPSTGVVGARPVHFALEAPTYLKTMFNGDLTWRSYVDVR